MRKQKIRKEDTTLIGSMNAPIQGEAHQKVSFIKNAFTNMQEEKRIEGVTARLSGNTTMFMDRIKDTTLYLSNNRKMIYDVAFVESYTHTGKIPANHLVVGNMLLIVEDWAHIDNTDKFLSILLRKPADSSGTRIYLDGVLYASNIPFLQSEKMRNDLIHRRNDGEIKFTILKVVDPSGNTTEFHATPLMRARMAGKEEEYLASRRGYLPRKISPMNHGG